MSRLRGGRLPPVFLICVAIAACGDSEQDTAEPAPEPPAPAASAPPPAPPPAPAPPSAAVLSAAVDAGAPLTAPELDAAIASTTAAGLAGAAACGVQMVDITYHTPAPDGITPVLVSGAVMLPGPGCTGPFPLVAYARGTDMDRTRAMATPGDEEARLVAALLAAQGYVVAATDYLGYARSTYADHPYLHADSQATSNRDALRAARELAAARGIALDGSVFLTGYSQGGHASMATQRLIESRHAAEFTLAGAGHMSGPYDLVGSVTQALENLPLGDLGSTYYVPFTVTALQKVYRNLYASPDQFFQAPYDATIENLFPGPPDTALQDLILEGRLPVLLSSLITPEFAAAVLQPGSPLNQALVANSPIDFAPQAPTLLCGGSRDPVVGFDNTLNALAAFQAAGSTAVSSVDLEAEPQYAGLLVDDLLPETLNTGYHASLVPPLCLLQVRNLFQTLQPAGASRDTRFSRRWNHR